MKNLHRTLLLLLSLASACALAQTPVSLTAIPFDTIAAKKTMDSVRVLTVKNQLDLALTLLDSVEVRFRADADPVLKKYQGKLLAANALLSGNARQNKKAAAKYQAAIKMLVEALGEHDLDVANVQFNTGRFYQGIGMYDSAIYFHRYAYAVRQEKLGEKNFLTAQSLMNLANNYMDSGQTDSTRVYLFHALKAFRALPPGPKNLQPISWLNNALGIFYFDKMEYDSALIYFRESAVVNESLPDPYAKGQLGWNYYNIANCYGNIGDAYQHKEYAYKALYIRKKYLAPNDFAIGKSYGQIGNAWSGLGDYYQALDHHLKSLEILLQIPNIPERGALAGAYNGLGNDYADLGNYPKSLEYYLLSLDLFKKDFGEESNPVAMVLSNIAGVYTNMADFDNAILSAQKSIDIRTRLYGGGDPRILSSFVNLGAAYSLKGDVKQALQVYLNALDSVSHTTNVDEEPFIVLQHNIGDSYRKLGNFEKAKPYFQTSLKQNRYRPDDFSNVLIPSYVGVTLKQLSKTYTSEYLAGQRTQPDLLRSARHLSQEGISTFEYQTRYFNTDTKSSLAYRVAEMYEEAMKANQLLFELTDSIKYLYESFDFAEHSKAALLAEGLRESNALHISGIPDSLLAQEYHLRTQIAYFDKRRQGLLSAGKNPTDADVLSVTARLLDQTQMYEALRARFERDFPDYYKLKYERRTVSLPSLQRDLLKPGQSMLEYFVGDSTLYVFAIRRDTFAVRAIPVDFPLGNWVEQLRFGLAGYYGLRPGDPLRTEARRDSAQNAYLAAATRLYDNLVAPLEPLLTPNVIVVPDGVLGYVPFETLLTGPPPANSNHYHKYPYWLLKHQISYSYSATLLQEMTDKQHRPTKGFLAFAPYYDGDTSVLSGIADLGLRKALPEEAVQPLKYSGAEVLAAQRLMGGEVFTDTSATEDRFNRMAGEFGVLHLSTHGRADDRLGDYSYLMFSPRKDSIENELLYCRDIYNLNLKADLVVLSACETGLGKLRRGEGIISLARAFSYAGAKSVVNSLWSVNDGSTQQLVVDFYKALKAGRSKSEALAEAKRMFLEQPAGNSKRTDSWRLFRHPYFWSGFILIGDDAALFQIRQ